ncbi:MAG: hypothetical protein H8E47_08645 [Anaerolineales bacterium]|nr:hypothetical protein [Anaerolineales bacterium]
MSKVTDARIAAIKALFGTGHTLEEDNFADLVDAIQEAAQEHEHVSGGGAGSGTGNAAPIKIWKTFVFCVPGDLEVGTRVAPSLFADEAMDIDHVCGYVQTESYESAIIVDVDKNGTTIFTDQGYRVWMFGTDWDSSVPAVTSLSKNDRLDIDIDQVGETTPGADLTIMVICKQDAVS